MQQRAEQPAQGVLGQCDRDADASLDTRDRRETQHDGRADPHVSVACCRQTPTSAVGTIARSDVAAA